MNQKDNFDLETWIESVRGHTVRVTPPRPNELGPEAHRLMSSPVPEAGCETWCDDCEAYSRLVKTDPDEITGHCPRCGKDPGMLELGSTKRFDEVLQSYD